MPNNRYSEDDFVDILNEEYGEVEIVGYTYMAGDVLREIDPIAFRELYLDWLDSEGIDEDDVE